jgi:hypothetical protein
MGAGVLLDTSYLITLADRNRPHHDAAKRYWKHFLENQIPIYLSTVVVSEFCLKQPLDTDILRHCVVLPFNYDDALKCAALNFTAYKDTGVGRDALKDDFKLIAQAEVKQAAYLITDDSDTMFKFCRQLKEKGQVSFQPIGLADGFDRSNFDPQGQRDFHERLEPATPDGRVAG